MLLVLDSASTNDDSNSSKGKAKGDEADVCLAEVTRLPHLHKSDLFLRRRGKRKNGRNDKYFIIIMH